MQYDIHSSFLEIKTTLYVRPYIVLLHLLFPRNAVNAYYFPDIRIRYGYLTTAATWLWPRVYCVRSKYLVSAVISKRSRPVNIFGVDRYTDP